MLTNVRSCLNQNPDWNCCATIRRVSPIAWPRTCCASRSAGGATNSPARKVTTAMRDADAHERPGDLQQRRARRAHHRVFGVGDELRHREQRADQRRHREELVHPRRHLQHDEQERRGDRVVRLAHVAQLVDQVEEREQHHQRAEDQHDRRQHLAADVAGQRGHAAAGTGARPAQLSEQRELVAEEQQHDRAPRSRAAPRGRSRIRACPGR